jgi:uncharacterized protein YjiS (DUF1127 family)
MSKPLILRFHVWWQDRVAIRKLHALDDRQLADMGASRDCITDFVHSHAKH